MSAVLPNKSLAPAAWNNAPYDYHGNREDEMVLCRNIFASSGGMRRYRRRLWRLRAAKYIKSWRPRFRVNIRLFPRLDKRLMAAEQTIRHLEYRIKRMEEDK